jgi:hypothetical protein
MLYQIADQLDIVQTMIRLKRGISGKTNYPNNGLIKILDLKDYWEYIVWGLVKLKTVELDINEEFYIKIKKLKSVRHRELFKFLFIDHTIDESIILIERVLKFLKTTKITPFTEISKFPEVPELQELINLLARTEVKTKKTRLVTKSEDALLLHKSIAQKIIKKLNP